MVHFLVAKPVKVFPLHQETYLVLKLTNDSFMVPEPVKMNEQEKKEKTTSKEILLPNILPVYSTFYAVTMLRQLCILVNDQQLKHLCLYFFSCIQCDLYTLNIWTSFLALVIAFLGGITFCNNSSLDELREFIYDINQTTFTHSTNIPFSLLWLT